MRRFLILILVGLVQIVPVSLSADESLSDILEYRSWINEMEGLERGPFSRLRWFCNDGTVFPPRPYACGDHGGGYQHGEWSKKTLELREQGYLVANVLAGLDASSLVDDPGFRNLYAQILIERFLISADDGWIMRRALFYRGAIQEEDERAAARDLLLEMASREHWIGPGFPALQGRRQDAAAWQQQRFHSESAASVRFAVGPGCRVQTAAGQDSRHTGRGRCRQCPRIRSGPEQ